MVRLVFYSFYIYVVCTVFFFQAQAVDLRSGEVMVLSPDIVQFIPDSNVNMLVVRVDAISASNADGVEQGSLQVQVVEVVSSKHIQVGKLLSIPFQRAADEQARNMQGFNAWNSINMARNNLLVLGIKLGAKPDSWSALTGDAIANVDDPLLAALREAFKIEHFKGVDEQRQILLQKALIYKHSLLRFYAIKAITERGLYKRKTAFGLFNSALDVKGVDEDIRLDLGRSLLSDGLLDTSLGNDETNSAIISEIACQMLKVSDESLRMDWTSLLASAVLRSFDDDETLDVSRRQSLVSTIREPSAASIIESLKKQIAGETTEDVLIQRELLAIWLKAS